ncbi:hypothetical protein [Acidimangrovimonas pyrenivorans]|uniref:Uncharacterized protein n=1 Tax=Acidimangrovimonas pyrenivorans TaxID=2030798 RepID=A0ABV7AFC9_9RHOB
MVVADDSPTFTYSLDHTNGDFVPNVWTDLNACNADLTIANHSFERPFVQEFLGTIDWGTAHNQTVIYHAQVSDGVVFDLAGGSTVTLHGLTTLDGLADHILVG